MLLKSAIIYLKICIRLKKFRQTDRCDHMETKLNDKLKKREIMDGVPGINTGYQQAILKKKTNELCKIL